MPSLSIASLFGTKKSLAVSNGVESEDVSVDSSQIKAGSIKIRLECQQLSKKCLNAFKCEMKLIFVITFKLVMSVQCL